MTNAIAALAVAAEAVSAIATLAFGSADGVLLGDFLFHGFEVPEQITVPGSHAMVVHKLVGGERVVDMLGDEPGDLTWSGTFMDGDPWSRAQQLEAMRAAGDMLPLQWGPFFYTVVIRSFSAKTLYSRVQYDIACTVIRNEATAPLPGEPTITEAVGSDLIAAVIAAPAILAPILVVAQSAVAVIGPMVPGSPGLAVAATALTGVALALGSAASVAGLAVASYGVAAPLGSIVAGSSALALAAAQAAVIAQSVQCLSYVNRAKRNVT